MNRFLFSVFMFLLAVSLQAQDNLIKNGDFTDSSGANWTFSANGAQATGKVEIGRYIITIERPSNRESAPQLSQRGFSLETDEGYTLSFKVSGQDTGYIKVLIDTDGAITYSDTNALKVPVKMNMATHTIHFFVQRQTTNPRLVFNCGVSDSLTRIAFDSVTLTKSATPIIRVVTPSVESRWVAGAEREIVWQNSGVLPKVKIVFSPDSGKTWSVIVSAASNQKSYWWNVPAATAGNNCLIVVSDTSGAYADTSAAFRIVAAGTIDRMEMVKNGDFLDTTNWRFGVNGSAKAKGSFAGDQYVIKIDTAGTEPWHVKLEQTGLTLENGNMYRFSYDAYASHECKMYANVGADNGNPAWSVFGGDTIPVSLDTIRTRFTHMIVMKYPTSNNIRVEFNCGTATGTIRIDNVSLIQVEAADAFILSPSLGQVLKSGAKFNIEWQAAKVTTVDLDYSIDSGKTWTAILDGVENLGILAWTAPDLSSELCFVRILKAGTDSVLGTSAMFQINKFGTVIKAGEMVQNGSFNNNQQGWNTSFDNAQGQTSFKDQLFELTIAEPGNSLGSIVLSQSGLTVLGGKEYTLSFEAFANGSRTMGIALLSDDTVKLLDSIIELPSVQQKITFTFSPRSDAITRLEFRMGGARAGVYIDNVSLYTGDDPSLSGVKTASVRSDRSIAFSVRPIGRGFTFSVPRGVNGTISIYNLQGVLLRTLTAADNVIWDGRNLHGSPVARGSYVAALTGKNLRTIRSFVVR